MMDRNAYNLSHLAHICGHIGRLQSLTIIPVEAGASLELNIDGIARLAANRKEIVSECQVDICAFFVPHRIIYGQDWIDFINAGVDETQTFTGVAVAADYRQADYLCLPTIGATINRSLLGGYNSIFYNYYSVPAWPLNNDSGVIQNNALDWFPTTETGADNCRKYGRLAARLPHVLNGGLPTDLGTIAGWEAQDLTDADKMVAVDTVGGEFSITDLAQAQARYKTEARAAWFSHFYQDVLREQFGGSATRDADPSNLRPEMLGRSTSMMSGRDIDGTDDATMGTFQGKTLDRVGFNMRRKFFGEHGNVYVLALLRYPLVHVNEIHPLLGTINPSYKYLAGQADIVANEPPVTFDPEPWLAGGSAYTPDSTIIEPYGQHYRFHPNRVHSNYNVIPGYPFTKSNDAALEQWYYHVDNEYRDTFQTTQVGQWTISAEVRGTKFSPIPGVGSSIFAGS